MEIISIIPARGGSKGIPGKNVMKIRGKPLIAWSIEEAKRSELINEVFVSSDSDEILEIAVEWGAKPIKRPDSLSNDTATSESALIHALEGINWPLPLDYVVFLQATSPVRRPYTLDRAIQQIADRGADSMFSACVVKDHFLWGYSKGSIQSITYDFLDRKPRQELSDLFLENGSFYIFRPEILFDNNNRLGGTISEFGMSAEESFQIDNVEDIDLCEYYLSKFYE
jgi:CMP-N,N'-diacetyllegionaminic acid synthase